MSAQFELDLPPTADAPRRARRQLLDWLGSAASTPELQTAALPTSDLVTNALIHGEGKISVRAQLDQDRLLVEVIDEGHGFERAATEADFEELGGHGLRIVEAEASRWGSTRARPTCGSSSSGRVPASAPTKSRRTDRHGQLASRLAAVRPGGFRRPAPALPAWPVAVVLADADGWLPGRGPKLCVFSLRRRPSGRTATIRAALARIARIAACPRARFGQIANCSSRGWGRVRRCCAQPFEAERPAARRQSPVLAAAPDIRGELGEAGRLGDHVAEAQTRAPAGAGRRAAGRWGRRSEPPPFPLRRVGRALARILRARTRPGKWGRSSPTSTSSSVTPRSSSITDYR